MFSLHFGYGKEAGTGSYLPDKTFLSSFFLLYRATCQETILLNPPKGLLSEKKKKVLGIFSYCKKNMTTSEMCCLKFKEFQHNVNTVFESLRDDPDLYDVNLACEDGHQVMANHIILTTSSPVLKNILGGKKHAHTIVYMRGIKSEDLMALVEFLYYGKIKIYPKNLNSFFKLAEEFKVKGLLEAEEGELNHETNTFPEQSWVNDTQSSINGTVIPIHKPLTPKKLCYEGQLLSEIIPKSPLSQTSIKSETMIATKIALPFEKLHSEEKLVVKTTLDTSPLNMFTKSGTQNATMTLSVFDKLLSEITATVPKQRFSGALKDLDSIVETMMGQDKTVMKDHQQARFKVYLCKVCGKEGQHNQIKDHIEVNHIEGVSVPCNFCDKVFRSRSALKTHTYRNHK